MGSSIIEPTSKEGVAELVQVMDPDSQEELGLLSHNGGRAEYVRSSRDSSSMRGENGELTTEATMPRSNLDTLRDAILGQVTRKAA